MMPTRSFSVILDGMDQHKTDLHHYQGWNDPNVSLPRRQQIFVKINSSVYNRFNVSVDIPVLYYHLSNFSRSRYTHLCSHMQ